MASAIVACFAHPDDETFAVGGTLALHAAHGVALACATRGEAGRTTGIGDAPDRAMVAQVREAELREAAAILGIGRVEIVGLPDGGLARADTDALVGALVRVIREERPRVVLTFGPEGAPTRHADHRAISRAATAAFFLAGIATEYADPAGPPPHRAARLAYLTWPAPLPGDELQAHGLPIDLCVATTPARDAKWRAFLAHRSQRHHEARFRALTLERDECFAVVAGVAMPEGATSLLDGII